MSTSLTDQISKYFTDVDHHQGAVDLAAVLRGETEREVTMVEIADDKQPERRRNWWAGGTVGAAAAAVLVVIGIVVVRSGDETPPGVAGTPAGDQVPFGSEHALAVAGDVVERYNAGDADGVLALFVPDSTFSYSWIGGSHTHTRQDFETYLAWNAGQRSQLIDRSCAVADRPGPPASEPGSPTDATTVVCTLGDQDAVTRAGGLDPVPITLTLMIAVDGIHDWNREIGSPDYLDCCQDFHRWVAANHPDVVEVVSGPPGDDATIETARADGELLARLADEWAATLTAPAADGSALVEPTGWRRIEGLELSRFWPEVVSDGRSFFAVTDGPSGTELARSDDGTTWATIAPVPFSRIDSARNGKVVATQVDDMSLTIYIVDEAGAVTRRDVALAVRDSHRPFVESVSTTTTFLGDGGLVIQGSYHLNLELVLAAALGVPIDEIIAARDQSGAAIDRLAAGALDLTAEEFEQQQMGNGPNQIGYGLDSIEIHPLGGGDPIVVLPLGPLDLGPGYTSSHPIYAISADGSTWDHAQVADDPYIGFGPRPVGDRPRGGLVAIAGGLVGWDGQPASPPGDEQFVARLSFDGIVWNEIIDTGTGAPLPPGGELRTGPNRAVYISNTTPRSFWEITAQGASPIDTSGTALESFGSGVDGDDWSMTFGEAGAAYLTGFIGGPQCPCAPRELVTSRDGRTWTHEALPDELIADSASLAVGAGGVIVTVADYRNTTTPVSLWYRKLDQA